MDRIFIAAEIALMLVSLTPVIAVAQGTPSTIRTPFPITMQFSPVPNGKGWKGEAAPLSDRIIHDTIDNMIEHGVTGLYCPVSVYSPFSITADDAKKVVDYAQSRGMFVTYQTGGLELFSRAMPPEICMYSPKYAPAVRKNVESALAALKDYPNVYNVFCYMDEPFHQMVTSFGYNEEVKAEFKKRYSYELPPDLDSIRDNPKVWLDVINFRADYFPDGWRQVYKIIKEINPNFNVIMTHDSHNTFGGAVESDGEIGVDDVFHWGGDFADTFVFDIYPYMMFDFRYGECSKVMKPRISQSHYAFAHMRNLARAYGKEMGFWFGTYNAAWFKDYLGSDLKAKYWAEREMSATAVAQGANFLLSGYEIPEDARHWDELGKGLRQIQKAGPGLQKAPKVKAKACFLFPRTQYIQLQEEYFNVGLAYELFLRAFGELDLLHEEQIKDDKLDGYRILCLFDIELLPKQYAERIAEFVRKGGIVIADCVPRMDSYKEPMDVMEKLFGVEDAVTSRIKRTGLWLPCRALPPGWIRPQQPGCDETPIKDTVKGKALGQSFDMIVVSPRPCKVTTGGILLKTASGQPALVHRKVGRGHVFLLGFCTQDSYFQTWKDNDGSSREQLRALFKGITDRIGLRSHVHSSNPDIEASLRANTKAGYLFVIDHESPDSMTTIRLADLPFPVERIVDLDNDRPVAFEQSDGFAEFRIEVPQGTTKILRLLPK